MTVQKFDYRRVGNFKARADLKEAFEQVVRTQKPILIVDARFEGCSDNPPKMKSVDRRHVVATLVPAKVGDTPDFGQRAGAVTIGDLKKLFKKDSVLGFNAINLWSNDTRKSVMAHAGLPRQGNLMFVRGKKYSHGHFELHPLTAEQSF